MSTKRIPSFAQLKHLPRFLSAPEKKILRLCGIVIVLCAIGLAGVVIKNHIGRSSDTGGNYTEGIIGAPRLINPVLATSDVDLDLSALIFSGLMKRDATGAVISDLAETYSVSANSKTYTFTLRKNVMWHDNVPFSSADVVATIQDIKNPAWKSPLAAQFKNVTVSAPTPSTVVFSLTQPSATFLSALTVGILPQHIWQNIGVDDVARNEINIKPVGTGPFQFTSLTKDKKGAIKSMVLRRNNVASPPAKLDTMTIKFFSDAGNAVDAAINKMIDGVAFLPSESRASLEKIPAFRAVPIRLPQTTAIFFNVKKTSVVADPIVRRALALALDHSLTGPMPEQFLGAQTLSLTSADTRAAIALLEKNNWKVSEGGVRSQTTPATKKQPAVTTPLALTLTTDDSADHVALATALQKSWTTIGAKTTIEKIPATTLRGQIIPQKKYDALLYGEILGNDLDLFPFWHSSQTGINGLNLSQWSNTKADQILEKARQATDDTARTALNQTLVPLFNQDIPAIFLSSPTYTYIINTRLQNFGSFTLRAPADRFANVANWSLGTKWSWQ